MNPLYFLQCRISIMIIMYSIVQSLQYWNIFHILFSIRTPHWDAFVLYYWFFHALSLFNFKLCSFLHDDVRVHWEIHIAFINVWKKEVKSFFWIWTLLYHNFPFVASCLSSSPFSDDFYLLFYCEFDQLRQFEPVILKFFLLGEWYFYENIIILDFLNRYLP